MANQRPHHEPFKSATVKATIWENSKNGERDPLQRHLLEALRRRRRAVKDDPELRAQRPAGSRQGRGSGSLAPLRTAADRG